MNQPSHFVGLKGILSSQAETTPQNPIGLAGSPQFKLPNPSPMTSELDAISQPVSSNTPIMPQLPHLQSPAAQYPATSPQEAIAAALKTAEPYATPPSTHGKEDWLTLSLAFMGGFLIVFALLNLILADFSIPATGRSLIVVAASLMLFAQRRLLAH